MSFKLTDEQMKEIAKHVESHEKGLAKHKDMQKQKQQKAIALFQKHANDFAFEFEKEMAVHGTVNILRVCENLLLVEFNLPYSIFELNGIGFLSYNKNNFDRLFEEDREKAKAILEFDNFEYTKQTKKFCIQNGYVPEFSLLRSCVFTKPEPKTERKPNGIQEDCKLTSAELIGLTVFILSLIFLFLIFVLCNG